MGPTQLLSDLGEIYDSIPIDVDNQRVIKLINIHVYPKRIKHIREKVELFAVSGQFRLTSV